VSTLIPSPQAIHTKRRARRQYRCDNPHCEPYPLGRESLLIQPGEVYVRSALPPGAEPFYADGWSVLRYHWHCLPVGEPEGES
jgi:hypothetical protein